MPFVSLWFSSPTFQTDSKFFIEWTAPEAVLDMQVELVNLQRQLAQWQYNWANIWIDPVQRTAVAKQAGIWSKRILEMSGLLR